MCVCVCVCFSSCEWNRFQIWSCCQTVCLQTAHIFHSSGLADFSPILTSRESKIIKTRSGVGSVAHLHSYITKCDAAFIVSLWLLSSHLHFYSTFLFLVEISFFPCYELWEVKPPSLFSSLSISGEPRGPLTITISQLNAVILSEPRFGRNPSQFIKHRENKTRKQGSGSSYGTLLLWW